MAAYSARQSTYVDTDTIDAADSNNEFDTILAAFNASTGHTHDGTAGEGATIDQLADNDADTMIEVENASDEDIIRFYIGVANVKTQQITLADGVFAPVTTNDVDLGTSSLGWKNVHVDGIVTVDVINEFSAAAGVTIDSVLVKDGAITTTGVIELGNASDTTLARSGAGDVTIEGQAIHRLGGTDITVADGGTGVSTLTDGGLLLGSGTGAITAMAVLADGSIAVGDGATDPVPLAAFTSSTGTLKHESGGLEFNASAVADGDVVVGTGTGTMGLESGTTFRTTVGLGTGDTPEFNGLDIDGGELILDADADTSITADTDDQIDIKIAGADDFQFTANTLTALSGSTIATNTIAETTGASGVTVDGLLIKDSTAAFADGTVATPSITNTGDTNTGVYFPAADTVGVTAGGVEQFRFGRIY
jgi:hypothetical protein